MENTNMGQIRKENEDRDCRDLWLWAQAGKMAEGQHILSILRRDRTRRKRKTSTRTRNMVMQRNTSNMEDRPQYKL